MFDKTKIKFGLNKAKQLASYRTTNMAELQTARMKLGPKVEFDRKNLCGYCSYAVKIKLLSVDQLWRSSNDCVIIVLIVKRSQTVQ